MFTKTVVLSYLAVSLLGIGVLMDGAGVQAVDRGRGDVCVETSEPGTCPSPLPSVVPASPVASVAPSASGEYDACFLATDSEMEDLFHRSLVRPPSGTQAAVEHDCVWSFGPELMEMAAVWLGAYDGWADLAGLMPETVPGLGDDALWVLGGLLYVRSGDTAFTVMVISDTLDVRDTAIAVARLALSRIP